MLSLELAHILSLNFWNSGYLVRKNIILWSEREREVSAEAADNAIGTTASLCPSRRCQTALYTPCISVPRQSVTSLILYVAKYLCVRLWVHEKEGFGALIPPLWDSPFAVLFLSPSFPTSHPRLAQLCWAQVSQSSAEGQTDFTVVGKRVMCLPGPGGLHS